MAPAESYRVAPYISAARQLKIPIDIASNGKHSLVTEIARGLHVALENPDEAVATIVHSARQRPYRAIIASDDYTTEIAARAAQQLGLPHNPPEAVRLTRWKHEARQTLLQAKLPVPWHKTLPLLQPDNAADADIKFPCVLKPLNLSGSKGVIRVNNHRELQQAIQRIEKIIHDLPEPQARSNVLVEAYIGGEEIAVEGVLQAGKFKPIAVFDKPDPLHGPYFEETIYVTPSKLSQPMQQRVLNIVQQACKAYGLRIGPVHAELRIDGDNIWILEIAARTIGGDCARLLEYASGFSLEALVISHAVGEPLPLKPFNKAAGVLMIPTPASGVLRRVEGVLETQHIAHIDAVHIAIREGHILTALPEGASYLGFVFASAPDAAQVEHALQTAKNTLRVVVAPFWKIER